MRADLPKGLQVAMAGHAIGDSVEGRHPEGTFVIVLAARDELDLVHIAERLEKRGVALVRVYEPDAPWNNALMALGLRPALRKEVRKHTSSLPLLK